MVAPVWSAISSHPFLLGLAALTVVLVFLSGFEPTIYQKFERVQGTFLSRQPVYELVEDGYEKVSIS